MKEFFKKHKKLVIFLIIIIILGAAVGYIVYSVNQAKKALEEMANAGEVVQIEERNLVNSLPATGTITSLDSTDIYANVSGVEVVEVAVSLGDYVKEGDVICILDSSDLETSLSNAQANLEVKEAGASSDVEVAKRHLNESITSDGVTVERNFEDLQDAYDDYLEAVEEYDQAVREYNTAMESYTYRASEYQNFLDAHADLSEIDRESLPDFSFYKSKFTEAESEMESKKQSMENKEDAADSALDKYNNLIRTYEDNERNNDSSVMDKNDTLNTAKRNSSVTGLSEEQQIDQYEDQIEACTVRATRDGVITSLSVTEGAKYSGTAIATIEDTSNFRVTSEIEEYNIAKVKEGQRVIIKTNGTGDIELEGVVAEVAPRATKVTNSAGVSVASNVTYKVKIDILTECEDLKLDMTAKISIVLEEKPGALTVPYDAVQTAEDGSLYIEKEDRTRITVTKGIESDYYTEIFGDGVEKGLKVFVPSANDVNSFMQMMMDEGAMGGM